MISLSSLLLLEAGYIEAKSITMPLPVPYSKYIFKESLSSLLRRSGLSEINLTNTKLSSNDDLDSQAYKKKGTKKKQHVETTKKQKQVETTKKQYKQKQVETTKKQKQQHNNVE